MSKGQNRGCISDRQLQKGSTKTRFLTRSSMRVIDIVSDRSSARYLNREGATESTYETTPYGHCNTLITAMIGATTLYPVDITEN